MQNILEATDELSMIEERASSSIFEEKSEPKIVPNEEVLHQLIRKTVAEGVKDQMEVAEGDRPKDPSDEKRIDSSIKMLCEKHNVPADFFSEKEDRYMCFQCVMSKDQLLYIDKSHKDQMDDFERIK